MSIKEKKVTIEADFEAWCEIIKSLDTSCDLMMAIRKLIKSQKELDADGEMAKVIPDAIMNMHEQMTFLKRGIAKGLSEGDMEIMIKEGIEAMKKARG